MKVKEVTEAERGTGGKAGPRLQGPGASALRAQAVLACNEWETHGDWYLAWTVLSFQHEYVIHIFKQKMISGTL